MGLSNIEDILQAGLDGETLPTPESRIAELLKEWIEQGGNIDDILVAGANITLTKNSDGTITIAATGEVSSEDTVARAEIAAIKDGETLDSFGDVETALDDKADSDNVYKLALSDADLLPANTDLGNVKTVGCYYVYSYADVSSIINRPTNNASAFRLTVECAAGEKRVRQIYQEFNSFDKYIRWENSSNVFSQWKKVECDLTTKQNTISDLTTIRSGAALGATAVQPVSGKGLSTNDYTNDEKSKLAGIAQGAEVNVQSNWTQTTTTADDYIKNKPTLGTAAAKNATDTYNATGTDVTTGKAVAAALATLPEPMVFKGSLGTGGIITTLPTASSSNKGYVYKVITDGTYASQSAKVGDTFISDGSTWVLIPSGDEPSGTVTNVAVANGGGLTVSGSPITSSGTITVGHSNSVTAKTSSSVKKFTYDAYGHVTGSSELSAAESNTLASGIDSAKVAQIETNKNNILMLEEMNGAKNLSKVSGGTKTGTGYFLTEAANTMNIAANTPVYMIFDYVIANGQSSMQLTDSDGQIISGTSTYTTEGTTSGHKVSKVIPSKNARGFNFYSSSTGNITISNIMIVPANIYEAGFTDYQPYAMSNAELTAAIQALQAQLTNQ